MIISSLALVRSYLFLFFIIICFACNNSDGIKNNEMNDRLESNIVNTPTQLLRHVVLFNFNDQATEDVVNQIEQKFAVLAKELNVIHDFEWGINNSPEGLDKGLTHCFLVTFLSENDRAAYLPHPKHKEFVEFIGPYVEDVTVVDYWTK